MKFLLTIVAGGMIGFLLGLVVAQVVFDHTKESLGWIFILGTVLGAIGLVIGGIVGVLNEPPPPNSK